ncbi:hypothetical protein QR680_016844 [Steinernema hermaphroditum]|uniref:G-protein coupled receptors family 1 profile domain-containing protein n=1 Tax=Steinernema hermaphroditum TaxID=289476 RepID=A0AA39LN76_9BILA|nr:hypothetical protein QR680_016844 [Steinernema hermaphroditum]
MTRNLTQSSSYFEQAVLGNKLYTFMVAIEFLAYVLSTLIGPYFFFRLRRISLLHANLRVILCNIPILFVLMTIHRFHFLVEYILIYVLGRSSMVSLSFQICISLRFVYDWGICVLAFLIPSFTLERLLATWRPKKYERTASPKMGFVVTFILYVLSFFYAIAFFLLDWNDTKPWHNSFGRLCCGMMFTQPEVFMTLAMACFGTYFACIPVLLVLYNFNVKKTQQYGLQHLGVRYQYSENVAALKSIFPSVVGYGCILTVNCTIILLQIVERNKSSSTVEGLEKIWFLEQFVNVLLALYTLSYLVGFFVTYAPLNKAFWHDFDWLRVSRRRRINDSTTLHGSENHRATTEAYFAQFNSQWK